MGPGVKARILSNQQDFTINDNTISQYIIGNFNTIPEETVTSLAEKTNTSESAVVRFCRKIGYSGFYKLKTAVTQETAWIEGNTQVITYFEDNVLREVSRGYETILNNLYSIVDVKEVEKAVSLITAADNVFIAASDSFKTVGMEMDARLSTLGIQSKMLNDRTHLINASVQADQNDVYIFFVRNINQNAYSGIANAIRERGAKIILFTQHYSKSNMSSVDASIVAVDKAVAKNSVSLSNNIMMLLLIDSVISLILKTDDKYVQMLTKAQSLDSDIESQINTFFYSP